MKQDKIIAIDIGGTNIKYALVSSGGEILSSGNLPTEAEKGIETLLFKLDELIQTYLSEEILGLSVSATGQIDSMQGKVVGGNPIIPGWIGCKLVKILEEKYHLPCVLENDVNCAALGEAWLGAGKGKKDFLCLTIGTGIGGGIILNHQLYRGASSVAGEFGKLYLQNKQEVYEKYASMSALVQKVQEKTGKHWNGKKIFDVYWQGEENIVSIVDEWIHDIAEGLKVLLYLWNPGCIILGGAVTHQGEAFQKKIEEELQKQITPNYLECLELKFANLGNHAGLLGAAFLLLDKMKQEEVKE
ncbi:N-acetylmannosamine kinase [Fusobacterium necrophorum subsp. funduliforme B35]|uniref:ROK family protein n=1 Tax=Fusobacterium necrophorum TaxID=859 RepID=UPI0004336F12|nr:ROK family protein [Fusobacterium necrophorum]EYD68666.1 N-acetylmannosamine kinase [Fusobacterium necrophorum subsp. funduliforme B35]